MATGVDRKKHIFLLSFSPSIAVLHYFFLYDMGENVVTHQINAAKSTAAIVITWCNYDQESHVISAIFLISIKVPCWPHGQTRAALWHQGPEIQLFEERRSVRSHVDDPGGAA